MASKRKPLSQRQWSIPKLRRWLIQQGITDNIMPHGFSVVDCDNVENPLNRTQFWLFDSDSKRLETIAFIILASGGYAHVQYNMLEYVKDSLYLWNKPIATTWSYLFVDMKGEAVFGAEQLVLL